VESSKSKAKIWLAWRFFLEVGLACLLDNVVIGDLIWELIKGLTGLF
jgi:hypothetical protein